MKSEKKSFSSFFVFSKFGFGAEAEMVFRASPGALVLDVLIKMLEVSAKTCSGSAGRPKI